MVFRTFVQAVAKRVPSIKFRKQRAEEAAISAVSGHQGSASGASVNTVVINQFQLRLPTEWQSKYEKTWFIIICFFFSFFFRLPLEPLLKIGNCQNDINEDH